MTGEVVTDLTKGVYRRLYSGFTKGQRINKLSLQAEAWFWRVLATVDDFGNGDADPDLCRDATAGGRRSVTAKQVSGWLREMQQVGLIEFYTVDGEPFLHVVGFEENQPAGKNGRRIRKFKHPGESKRIQDNPDVVSASYSYSHSYSEDDNHNENESAERSPVVVVFEFWKERIGNERAQLTPERQQKISERLADSTVEEIKTAIDGCRASDFHMGRLPNQPKKNNSIELICKDRGKLEYFIEMAPTSNGHSKPPPPKESETERLKRENCSRCYGTGTEVIPGKGGQRCDHRIPTILGSSEGNGVDRASPDRGACVP